MPKDASGHLIPGPLGPMRRVDASIVRPEYVDKPAPQRFTGDEVKDAETIERMRVAGRLAARARELVGSHVVPGVTTDELDRIGHEHVTGHGAYPSTLGYRGFAKSVCSSTVPSGMPWQMTSLMLEHTDLVKPRYPSVDG